MGHRAAAILVGRNHHFNAVGAEDAHRRAGHRRIEQTLHAAQDQSHPIAPRTGGGHHQRVGIAERLCAQRRQQPFHRRDLWPEQAGESAASRQILQGAAGVKPQRLQHGPQALGVGQQAEQQGAETVLPGATQLRGIQLRPRGFDQFVVAHPRRAGADAGQAAQTGIEMPRHRGIEGQLSSFDRLEHVDPPPRRIHLRAQHPVAGAARQAETAMDARVGGAEASSGAGR